MQRRVLMGLGAGVVVALGVLAWWQLTPRRRGLAEPRIVLVTGEATLDSRRIRAAQPFLVGVPLRTGLGSACFSVHASRVCLGANTRGRLAELSPDSARIEADQGVIVLRSSGDQLRLTLPDGTVDVQNGVASVEVAGGDVVVRALEGSPSVQAVGKAAVVVHAPSAVGLRDGARRPPAPQVEREEMQVTEIARRWQGSAGAILQVDGFGSLVEIDGDEIGRAPASVLLDEGEHTLVTRTGPHDAKTETLHLKAGETVVRGG
jgi:hypothetical protein